MKYIFLIFIFSITITNIFCHSMPITLDWIKINKCDPVECRKKCGEKDKDGVCAIKRLDMKIEFSETYCLCADKNITE
uniref:Uncharacterized protein n=1 Tax=Strongyloides stercoralis TaxID=6248 RepID=A0A0K0EGR4_STRER